MKNAQPSNSDLVTDEVQINFDVLHALMLHWVRREINNTYIATVNLGGTTNRRVKFAQELAEPAV
jgi:hypothetical protein